MVCSVNSLTVCLSRQRARLPWLIFWSLIRHLPLSPGGITLQTPPFPTSLLTPFPKGVRSQPRSVDSLQPSKLSCHVCLAFSFHMQPVKLRASALEKTLVIAVSFEKNKMDLVAELLTQEGLFKILAETCFAFRKLKHRKSKIIYLFFQNNLLGK